MSDGSAPIGVFDSGVGGLTVARALTARLGREDILYLGDTARVPYGSKSAETVARYSRLAADFLIARGIKLLVIACNTASAYAVDTLSKELDVPVLGVIEPGARRAVEVSTRGRVGVIGTLGTVRSGAYTRAIHALDPKVIVTAHACPMLVPLAEEGWIGDDPIAHATVRRYLAELAAKDPDLDTLVLGCTHYPLLKDTIEKNARELFGHALVLVDSAEAMAEAVAVSLDVSGRAATRSAGRLSCFVTDEARIAEVGARFFGHELSTIERVDL